ncbi:MAG: hypothetical protein M3235_15970, partial [Actinomycetota bacterium]|nr:hypothetical protein [Actinomycetota bacterium]
MAHFVMSTAGAHGHVNPNLPVMSELVARGHRVSYTCPRSFVPIVSSSGATPLVVRSDLPDAGRGERWPAGGLEAMRLFLEEGRGVHAQLRDALADDRPDAVLFDGSGWAGHALARAWDLPRLALMPNICAEALFHGVPMVAVPQAVDEFGNADQLVALGVAEQVATGDVTPELLRSAVDRVASSPDVAAACAEQRARARAAGGARA